MYIREAALPAGWSGDTRSRFVGCFLGHALGDALGAPFEGGVLERLLWRVIGTTRGGLHRWTDDTQMTLTRVGGGDVDTIGAMAGALWGARNGSCALPTQASHSVEQAKRIEDTAIALYEAKPT